MQKFWNMVLPEQDDESAELYLEGEIASESWWGDEVTPAAFRADLAKVAGRDVTVWINSPGGDVIAASVIYSALMEHKGKITVKIDGLAASAASVIAMAGDTVLMAPTAYLMIHNPWSMVIGNAEELRQEAAVLDEIADGLVLAYQIKTGMSRAKLQQLMDDETWMSARTAMDYGFADGLLTRGKAEEEQPDDEENEDGKKPEDKPHDRVQFGRIAACARLRQRILGSVGKSRREPEPKPQPATQAERDAFISRLQAAEKNNHLT